MTPIVPPTPENLARAGAILRAGGLVAFPTETVYGLGANTLDPAAVAKIFAAKGRPATNPVIVHVASVDEAVTLIDDRDERRGLSPPTSDAPIASTRSTGTSPAARRMQALAERFWPGPLTLVLPKSPRISDIVTADGPTIAIRIPNHPVALELLRSAAVPLAAPSANLSTQLSPTRAEHVARSLDGRIDLILDGGPTTGGIESTVLDITTEPPTLLRPGLISAAMIEAVLGPIRRGAPIEAGVPTRSPGQQEKHYAPRTPLEIAPDTGWEHVERHLAAGRRVGWLTLGPANRAVPPGVEWVEMPTNPQAFASCLYDTLHILDAAGLDVLVLSRPPVGDLWTAVHDRLYRAGRFSE
jgi:L-threonylcarbamoyladenylate synthase